MKKKENNYLVLELRYWLLRSVGAEEYRSAPGVCRRVLSASSSSGSCQTLNPSRDLEREIKKRHKETATDKNGTGSGLALYV